MRVGLEWEHLAVLARLPHCFLYDIRSNFLVEFPWLFRSKLALYVLRNLS